MKKGKRHLGVKLLLVPLYATWLCAVMYFIGVPAEKWDKWRAWADRKFGKKP